MARVDGDGGEGRGDKGRGWDAGEDGAEERSLVKGSAPEERVGAEGWEPPGARRGEPPFGRPGGARVDLGWGKGHVRTFQLRGVAALIVGLLLLVAIAAIVAVAFAAATVLAVVGGVVAAVLGGLGVARLGRRRGPDRLDRGANKP